MGLCYPYDTASLTNLSSLALSPSLLDAAVTAKLQVARPDRARVDGAVTVTASTGGSCSDSTPAALDAITVEFACNLTFGSAGTRRLCAVLGLQQQRRRSVA